MHVFDNLPEGQPAIIGGQGSMLQYHKALSFQERGNPFAKELVLENATGEANCVDFI